MGESDAKRPILARVNRDLLAWFAFLIAAIAMAARLLPVINHAVLVLAALSPYLSMLSGLSALMLIYNRRRWSAAVALGLLAAAVGVQAPRFIGAVRDQGRSVEVRVVTANLFEGDSDPEALAAIARSRADLLITQELTPELAGLLQPLEDAFPYHAIQPGRYAKGTGIWSRYPLAQSSRITGYEQGMLTATVRVPGAVADTVVLALHLAGPWPQPIDGWRREIAALPRTLADVAQAAGRGAVIVAGDFNATADMQPFRRLLDTGYRDAAAQAGAGVTPTYPSGSRVPPLIGIDHILTYDGSASDVHTVRIPGSDHLGLAATIHLPG
jgi:endonuclease/exonuclease/phosphatase (EEP) superfamily protein YafD